MPRLFDEPAVPAASGEKATNAVCRKLSDSDMYAWSEAAKQELEVRKTEGVQQAQYEDLEKQADKILRDAGFKP